MSNQTPTIDRLLNLVPDAPESVLVQLRAHPELASKQDAHGYSLLHAATSYDHIDLLRALIQEFHVDPNLTDEDGETCLFNAESVDFAKELLALGVRTDVTNSDGQTAAEKLDDEDEQPEVAAYLRQSATETSGPSTHPSDTNGSITQDEADPIRPPPPLPNGVQVTVGTMHADEVGGEPDPEFRRRIEELAARQDFEGTESQSELRNLVTDAVSGLHGTGQGSATRRRLE
ncbi:hypothetical protein BDY17DRAFT_323149 [Neohortaea acidophila]|uniref:Uncharacterized protein n=1 Tax=Neohortaea acidophila TaxID=245834 RepID=A0A6A6PVW4_9PEZI|nr:uncharacterized protein BDY17DRAFT_323149 [Neohortaea acidophila]KAF2484280.1 hypothetical protein BDY17DRAFT_323149 [Neohortaea acidophila]